MSKCPWPDRLKAITRRVPSRLHLRASSIATRIACADSGAGMIPSARENRTGNRNNGHLMTVDTQAERAQGAAAATRNFAALPEIVGTHWFQYYDHPKGGRADGEDYNFGLVDVDDRPYEQLTEALAAVTLAA